jgi:myo-inositol-1(or 4)-monophosphatase
MKSDIIRTLETALRSAGEIHRRMARGPLNVAYKGRVDIVTRADKAAERAIHQCVSKSFPDHGFLLEEAGARPSTSGYRWIVDPLDGTINYAHRVPICCVSIGVEKDGVVVAGGVYDAFRDELFMAVRGKGARLNGRKIHVSTVSEPHKALAATGFPYDRQKLALFYAERVGRALTTCRDLRRLGAAALDLSYVACGRFDIYWEFNLKPWDVAAGWLLVQEAGGRVTRMDGKPCRVDDPSETLATNGLLHPKMSKLLRG